MTLPCPDCMPWGDQPGIPVRSFAAMAQEAREACPEHGGSTRGRWLRALRRLVTRRAP